MWSIWSVEGNPNCYDEESAVVVIKYNHNLGRNPVTFDPFMPVDDFLEFEETKNFIRTCKICGYKLLPFSDVAALVRHAADTKSLYFACKACLKDEVFHICHVSCLIQWIAAWQYWKKHCGERPCIECPVCYDMKDKSNWSRWKSLLENTIELGRDPEPLDQCSIGFAFPVEESWKEYSEFTKQHLSVAFYATEIDGYMEEGKDTRYEEVSPCITYQTE